MAGNGGSDGVSDSTDWLSTSLPSLSALDSAVRCQVCRDFYNTPMITSCSHTFCSLCIRRCLSNDGKCPACRTPDQASKLRRNNRLEEVVDAFKTSRHAVLQLAQHNDEKVSAVEPPTRKRTATDAGFEESQSLRRSTRLTHQSSNREGQTGTASHPVMLDGDSDHLPEARSPRVDGLVPCPICGKRMRADAVFTHLDNCPGPGAEDEHNNKPSTRTISSFTSASRQIAATTAFSSRLPQFNYTLLKEKELRKKLQEVGLPAWGTKPVLERRHKEWVNLFNSNCDSERPKPLRELVRELDIWERSVGNSTAGNNVSFGNPQQPQLMDKDFDAGEWKSKHKSQFDDLITQARSKVRSKANSSNPSSKAGYESPQAKDEENEHRFNGQHTSRHTLSSPAESVDAPGADPATGQVLPPPTTTLAKGISPIEDTAVPTRSWQDSPRDGGWVGSTPAQTRPIASNWSAAASGIDAKYSAHSSTRSIADISEQSTHRPSLESRRDNANTAGSSDLFEGQETFRNTDMVS